MQATRMDSLAGYPLEELASRLLSRHLDSGCWSWTGPQQSKGYGQIGLSSPRRLVFVHRLAYEVFVGPIPYGMTIDHLCSNKLCINPGHLEVVTRGENTRRGHLCRKPTADSVPLFA